jgi:hypothetical protein
MANNADRPGVDVHAAVEVFHRQADRVATANDSRGADENIDSWKFILKMMYLSLNYLNILSNIFPFCTIRLIFMSDSHSTVIN